MDIITIITFACAVILLSHEFSKLKKRIERLEDHIDQIRNEEMSYILMEDVRRAKEKAFKNAMSRYHPDHAE